MQDDRITIELRLAGLKVLEVKEEERWIEVLAQYRNEETDCPRCGRATWQVHQWHLQRKRDARLWKKPVWLALLKRRFRCRNCRKVFTEQDPVCGRGRRTTARLRETVASWASEATVRAVARVEEVSEGLVERSWMEKHSMVRPQSQPHVLLGLDGFCVRKPGRMWTGMWDLQTGQGVAFIPEERQASVQKMLERHASRETVRAVATDLSEPLERLTAAEGARVVEALSEEPDLARAWALKEGLRAVYKQPRAQDAAAALDTWIRDAQTSGLRPFQRAGTTLRKWQREVLN